MADDYDEYGNPIEPSEGSRLRKNLEEALAELKELRPLKDRVPQLEREITIRDAGLTSLNETQRRALAASHQGTWDTDAITKTATELGFVKAPEPPAVVDDPSLAQHQAIADAQAGTDPAPTSRDAEIDAMLAKATTEEEFLRIYRESGRPVAQ